MYQESRGGLLYAGIALPLGRSVTACMLVTSITQDTAYARRETVNAFRCAIQLGTPEIKVSTCLSSTFPRGHSFRSTQGVT